jgi:hypothetical protein
VDGNPFDFVWPVDQDGYEIWCNPHDPETARLVGRNETVFIRPRGGPLRYYRPLDFEGLWLRFAECCKSAEGALSFASQFGFLLTLHSEFPDSPEQVDDFLSAAELTRQIAKCLDASDRISAAKFLNDAGGALVTEVVLYNERTAVFERVLTPMTLLGALLHQAAEAISGDRRFRRCRNKGCPNWFRVGPRAGTARREFCSDRCRVASARRQKREMNTDA